MSTGVVYLDNNATTRPDPRVVEALLPLYTELWGNPSSAHHFGAQVAQRVEDARRRVAALIGARAGEIVFTGGGTEADNAALRGVLAALPEKRHLVISAVEHHAIFETAERLEHEGVVVTKVGVDGQGRLNLDELRAALRDDTALVSVMLANNETGVIYPLREICELAHARDALVHTDAVNALGKLPVDVEALGVDLLSLSAHKIYGPKGVGALYQRRGTPFLAWQIGGGQERRRRGGTLNAAGIVALGAACALLQEEQERDAVRIAALRARLERGLRELGGGADADGERGGGKGVGDVHILGAEAPRLPNTTCACFAGLASESILIPLSEAGVCVSSGSACTSGSLDLSHVLQAMHVDPWIGQGQIRFSLGRFNTEADIDRLFEVLPGILDRARKSQST